MVVASGQMPYEYDAPLPIRALPNAWPGIGTPNIATSGDTVEQAMFVYNAELRKWNITQLDLLTYQAYWHPDVASSGFEPKADGETLTGLVGPTATVLAVDNIEQMRQSLNTFLFDVYSDDSAYGQQDFLSAWLKTAYPESPSGDLRIIAIIPNVIYSFGGRTYLRPAAEHITGGDFIDTDIHWLGGSGVLFDIDCGEVIFQPFPFPIANRYFTGGNGDHRFNFSPITPVIQTTLGAIPSLEVARYESDIVNGSFRANTNFAALGSGKVQIDGYVLLDSTTIELVKGNDNNFEATVGFTDDYTNHIQGLREVRGGAGQNDPSARCYRTPTAQSSGLYRLLTHNQKVNVPQTAIPSGFVSVWPQGGVILASDGTLRQTNRIDGQQLEEASDGTMILNPSESVGVHVMDDAIWVTSVNAFESSGNLNTRGLFVLSPHNGDLVWYRPADLTVATSGNSGPNPGPGTFGIHVGLSDLGGDFVRLSQTASQFLTLETNPTPSTGVQDIYWQRYDQTTLDHTEQRTTWTIETTGSLPVVHQIAGSFSDGSNVYMFTEPIGQVTRFTTGLVFDGFFTGSIAGRRHYAGGDLLYTITDAIQVGDPMLDPGFLGTSGSGIGKWSISAEPSDIFTDNGNYTHDSAKPLRGEAHFGFHFGSDAMIHSIFDVTASTHVRNGVWMLIQFNQNLYLARIVERASDWLVVESIQFRDLFDDVGVFPPAEFPIEGILHDID